ncbi:MAG TPA: hypothetical protein VF785_04485 [Gemmatimonadaceae bacterium]
MRRALLLLALCGCASGGTSSESSNTTPKQAAIYSSPETGVLLAERPTASSATIAAPPAAVWLAVKKIYADWDIPVTVENPSTHQIGNPNFSKSRQMAGKSMTDFVDCGSGMTGPKSATYRIYSSLLTDVMTDGKGGTKVRVTFVPMGQDVAGGSADRIPCGTTGRLEQLLLGQVQASVGKS